MVSLSEPDEVQRGKTPPKGMHPEAVWCPKCRDWTFPHDVTGACLWCDLRLVGEDIPTDRDPVPNVQGRTTEERLLKWPKPEILKAIQAWHQQHGTVPTSRDWTNNVNGDWPSRSLVALRFGSFSNAIEKAGFPRPPAGRRKKVA